MQTTLLIVTLLYWEIKIFRKTKGKMRTKRNLNHKCRNLNACTQTLDM